MQILYYREGRRSVNIALTQMGGATLDVPASLSWKVGIRQLLNQPVSELIELHLPQPQTVGDNRHAGKRHGKGGQHRMKRTKYLRQESEGVEHPSRHRDKSDVVEKGPEEVLPDGAHSRLAQRDGLWNGA